MAVGQVGFKDNKKVKRLHVVERLNPIVNRLNKTKIEKHPDLRQEREDRQRDLRKKDRATQQERVSTLLSLTVASVLRHLLTPFRNCRRRKRLASPRSTRSWHGRRIMPTMMSSRTIWLRNPATKTGTRTSWTTSCSGTTPKDQVLLRQGLTNVRCA